MRIKFPLASLLPGLVLAACLHAGAAPLKVHGIFGSHMVLQRDKPIDVWGWGDPGNAVTVSFGGEQAEATAAAGDGHWRVTFDARPADASGLALTVASGGESVAMEDILIGDVWVMNGQSNMAWSLGKSFEGDLEAATANLPLLRRVGISPNESETLQSDLPESVVSGWAVCSPETAGNFGAIGHVFGSRLQQALGIPIGIIDNARGGASIESLVPRQKFAEDPLAARYLAWVDERRDAFDWDAAVRDLVERWEKDVGEKRAAGVAEDRLPARPTRESIRSWNVPGRSPSDAAACYNGMFGAFKGLNIKGVMFHQGYNNAMPQGCRPQRYRTLVRLMIEGWREDFNDPQLPVGVIEFCAGGVPQGRGNFEIWSNAAAAYIREAQRLGVADLGDPEHTAYIPGHDQQIPGLHPPKKQEHGLRGARWALKTVYGMRVDWEQAALVSAVREGDTMVLTFDKPVAPHDARPVEGFALAGADGRFFMAYASSLVTRDQGIWGNQYDRKVIHVWSPMVGEPVAVRYAWATSPMGNLMVNGRPWQPLHGFRTDDWDWPESEDPAESLIDRGAQRSLEAEHIARLEARRDHEAAQAAAIEARLKTLGHAAPAGE